MSNTCLSCGSSNPTDFDDSTGRLVCTNCGHVVNDSFIVSEISFGETSSGAARVQGSYVAEGQTHAGGGGGRFRSGNTLESREQIIQNGEFVLSFSYSTPSLCSSYYYYYYYYYYFLD